MSPDVNTPAFNAAIGIAFVLFYVRGCRAIPGVVMALFCTMILSEYSLYISLVFTVLYSIVAYLGSRIAHRIIKTDVYPFKSYRVMAKYISLCVFLALLPSYVDIIIIDVNRGYKINSIDKILSYSNGLLLFGIYILNLAYLPYIGSITDTLKKNKQYILLLSVASLIMIFSYTTNYFFVFLLAQMVIMICFYRDMSIIVIATYMSISATLMQANYFSSYKNLSMLDANTALFMFVYIIVLSMIITKKSKGDYQAMLLK